MTLSTRDVRAECEAIWNARGVRQISNVTIWTASDVRLCDSPGEARDPEIGASAKAFLRKVRKHWGPPPPAPYQRTAPLRVPDWLRARYKENCPRNYKQLVAWYGLTHPPARGYRPHVAMPIAPYWEADRVASRKIEAASKIIARIDRARLPLFFERFGVHLDVRPKDHAITLAEKFLSRALAKKAA